MFVKHIRSDQDLSNLLHIGLKWSQLHANIARPIFECLSLDLPYLEVGWFQTLRKFLCFINAEIYILIIFGSHKRYEPTSTLWRNLSLTHTTSQTPTCINSTYAASISEWNFSRKSVTRKATAFYLKSGKAADHKNCPVTSYGQNKRVRSKNLGPYGEAHSSWRT